MLLIERLKNYSETIPQKTAIQTLMEKGYEQISYSDLYNAVLNSASILADLGLKAGDHVAIFG
ncbi:MAG: AMP-binding protein, partial [Candidatus Dadabacteria bacterium]|nr:AMP-binding protein [Candidatus Dadabacteria bacterium]